MVTIEVNLKEGDEEPEQHLEEGEHIERVVVPLDQLYEKLQGTYSFHPHSVNFSLLPFPSSPSPPWTPAGTLPFLSLYTIHALSKVCDAQETKGKLNSQCK
jgi:hypothetical protein